MTAGNHRLTAARRQRLAHRHAQYDVHTIFGILVRRFGHPKSASNLPIPLAADASADVGIKRTAGKYRVPGKFGPATVHWTAKGLSGHHCATRREFPGTTEEGHDCFIKTLD